MINQKDKIIEIVKGIADKYADISFRSVDASNDVMISLTFDSNKNDSDLWHSEAEVWDEDEECMVDNGDDDNPEWIAGPMLAAALHKLFPKEDYRITSWAHEKGLFSVEIAKRNR